MSQILSTLSSLAIPPSTAVQLDKFIQLFKKWNRSINLSAARDDAEIAEHVLDSLHVIPHIRSAAASDPASAQRLLDVGAGGGLPAVVIAICLPSTEVTALEPIHKKHAFLRSAARELQLANLIPHAHRLDDHPHRDYDVATSRATFDLREWLLLGLTAVRPDGIALGFEALPRNDLPPTTTRSPYALDGKSRAIVAVRRPVERRLS